MEGRAKPIVFGEGHGFWETVLALVMLLVPTGVLILVLAIPWRWAWVGGVLFAALGVVYMVWAWGRFYPSVYVTIAAPLFLMSYLFFLNWRYRKEIREKRLGI